MQDVAPRTGNNMLPAREERLFLLSIFIGVLSGLLVVSFRMAIEWMSVLLLGAAPARINRDCSLFQQLPGSWLRC